MIILRFTSQMSLIVLLLLCAVTFNTITCCHEKDRSLLLMFKQGVIDPSNRLSSWSSLQDCCHWQGVECDDNTSRVIRLSLATWNENGSEPLRGEINLYSLLALEFLEELFLDHNDFERIRMPSINNSVATHTHLLSNSSSQLSELSLSGNINLHINNLHYWLSLLPSLAFLDLSGIHHLSSETKWVQSLALLPLETLQLHDCNLTSSILSLQYVNFSSLWILDLGLNDFRYGLPNWLFNMSKDLSHLYLNQCNLGGQIPDASGNRNLIFLDLSSNKLKGSIPDWLGQLDRLTELDLSNNSFHSIPSILMNVSSSAFLDISFNDLSGTLPKYLDKSFFSRLDLSHNLISGDISTLLLNSKNIFMSFNKFTGQLPRVSDGVRALDLSHNSFSGPLSSLLCHTDTNKSVLEYLDLSNNYITQALPRQLDTLSYIYLGNNQLVGQVPPTMGSSLYHHLRALDLNNNDFFGDMPLTFHNCTSLVLLNLEGNNFSGSIQAWIPRNISIVKLRSNQFTGNIPPQICSLSNLIVLDLANNRLSGSISYCLFNITSLVSGFLNNFLTNENVTNYGFPYSHEFMKIDLHTKGQQLEYESNLEFVRSIDLSANKLLEQIPTQLFKLIKLQSLNLSYNYLIGKIPEQIREMKDLESLDFSHNSLHGNIPQSMSSLSFLSDLNLSYNHGQIPLETQLQSFDAWSYTGNPKLCGPPLQKKCTIPEKLDNREQVEGNSEDVFLKSLYLGLGVGFAVGFWVVCVSLFLNRAWRHTYFLFFDSLIDRIYVIVAIKFRRFR